MSKGLISIAPFHLCIAAKAGNQFRNAVTALTLIVLSFSWAVTMAHTASETAKWPFCFVIYATTG